MSWIGRHIISIEDFSRDDLLQVLRTAASCSGTTQPDLLLGSIMSTLFFEPSTRTRLSFEAAICKLGGKVIGFSDAGISSARKGESLADTVRMVERYSDVIVLRHPYEGAARLASEVSRVPVINGGDGSNQHPTQTFLDLYTIDQLFPGQLAEGGRPLTIALAGDLRYGRTVHSLLAALAHFDVEILTVAVPGLELPEHHQQIAHRRGLSITVADNLAEAIRHADVLYMTRLQEERFPDPLEFDHIKSSYRISAVMLGDAKRSLRILHPLPRINEIARDVDDTQHAHYFVQAGNGLPVRQAILGMVLGAL